MTKTTISIDHEDGTGVSVRIAANNNTDEYVPAAAAALIAYGHAPRNVYSAMIEEGEKWFRANAPPEQE